LNFNATKYAVLRIGKSCKRCAVTVNGITLQFAKEVKYIGVRVVMVLLCNLQRRLNISECVLLWLKLSSSFHKAQPTFFRAANGVLSKCRKQKNEVFMMHLLSPYCKPLLLHGKESICFSISELCVSRYC